jgi:hypothetical protein
MTRPFVIPKRLVWEAYQRVKANGGSAGVDQETIETFESKLGDNLYKLWSRMESGSYFPPPVKAVPIPKKSGGTRILGVPTVADRVAQTVVKAILEPMLEPVFDANSYGYRPGRSALDAVAVVRRRNWEYDWVVEFDIKGLFDNIDHELLLRAVRKHCAVPWVLLYIERWLKAPMEVEGQRVRRERGTPQGGVVSPVLANLFLHYCAPGQTWCFQRVKFPPRQEVQPPYRESSLGFVKATTRTKRRQSDERAVTKVKLSNLVKYSSAGRQRSSGWQAPVGSPQMAMVAGDCGGVMSTARSEMEASRDLGDPPRSWFVPTADRVCRTIWLTPENGRRRGAKSDSLVVLRARESRVHGEAAKQMKTGFGDTSPAPTEAGA